MGRATKVLLCAAMLIATFTAPISADGEVAPATPTVKQYPSVPKYLFQSTYMVQTFTQDSDGHVGGGFGSGVAIDMTEYGMGGNYLLTAAHVVLDDKGDVCKLVEVRIEITSGKTRGSMWVAAKVVAHDKYTDLAILRLDDDLAGKCLLAKEDTLDVGDALAAVGCPSASAVTVTFGYLTSKQAMEGGSDMPDELSQASMSIYPGNSGGPVFDPNTKMIVGVIVAGQNSRRAGFASNVAYFVPLKTIRKFFDKNLKKMQDEAAKSSSK